MKVSEVIVDVTQTLPEAEIILVNISLTPHLLARHSLLRVLQADPMLISLSSGAKVNTPILWMNMPRLRAMR